MLQSTNQRVGALAGLLLFFGSWLSGYYNHWVWAALTIILAVVALWFALDEHIDDTTDTRVMRGVVTGLIAGVVARLMGYACMAWVFDSWTGSVSNAYSVLGDYLKVLLNGNFWQSVAAVLLTGVAGAVMAYALPYFVAEKEDE